MLLIPPEIVTYEIASFLEITDWKLLITINKEVYYRIMNNPEFKRFNNFLKRFKLTEINAIIANDLTILKHCIRKAYEFNIRWGIHYLHILARDYNASPEMIDYLNSIDPTYCIPIYDVHHLNTIIIPFEDHYISGHPFKPINCSINLASRIEELTEYTKTVERLRNRQAKDEMRRMNNQMNKQMNKQMKQHSNKVCIGRMKTGRRRTK